MHVRPSIALFVVLIAAPASRAQDQHPSPTEPTPRPPVERQPPGAPSTSGSPGTTAPKAAQATAPQTGTTRLTLAQAQQLALAQASALTQAEQDVHVAEEDVHAAKIGFLPLFTGPLQYIFTSPMHGPAQNGVPFTEREPAFIANNAVNEYVLLANAEGALDVNGKLRATLDKSRADLARARAAALVARRGLASAVNDAYYGLALARGKREIAEETLRSAQEFLAITKLLFEGGEVAEVDTLKARVDMTARNDELLQARAAEVEAADTLNALAGIGFGTPTAVEEIVSSLPVPAELDGFTADQVRSRPELAGLEAEEQSADAEVRIARAERLPSLSYSVSAGVDDSRVVPSRDLGASAAVTLSVPIFDWGAARGRQRQAEFRREAARRGREIAERALRQQYSTARVQAETASERVRIAGDGLSDATRALDISVARYQAGEAPVTEVIDARTTLAERRAAYYQAIYDYHVALDRLRAAVGR